MFVDTLKSFRFHSHETNASIQTSFKISSGQFTVGQYHINKNLTTFYRFFRLIVTKNRNTYIPPGTNSQLKLKQNSGRIQSNQFNNTKKSATLVSVSVAKRWIRFLTLFPWQHVSLSFVTTGLSYQVLRTDKISFIFLWDPLDIIFVDVSS